MEVRTQAPTKCRHRRADDLCGLGRKLGESPFRNHGPSDGSLTSPTSCLNRDRKRTGRFGAADQESGRRRCAARMNARGNSQSRALAIHPPVRTALTPAVGSDFAKVLSKLPPEELERCSELLYNQRARPVPRQQRAAALGSTFASARSREHGLPHQGHGLHPSLSHRWTAAQFLGALARVASGEPRSASPIPTG